METTLTLPAASSIQHLPQPGETLRSYVLPLLEDCNAQQLQLRALLAVTLDAHGGLCRLQSQDLRDGFLLACSMMGDEVRQLAAEFQNRLRTEHAA